MYRQLVHLLFPRVDLDLVLGLEEHGGGLAGPVVHDGGVLLGYRVLRDPGLAREPAPRLGPPFDAQYLNAAGIRCSIDPMERRLLRKMFEYCDCFRTSTLPSLPNFKDLNFRVGSIS